jgi:outer membrane protein OmpA-like peptidoglycan-associated protein
VPTAAPASTPATASAAAPAAAIGVAASGGAAALLAALAREPKADADRDGVSNADDRCPLAPRSAGGTEPGCPEGHDVDLEAGQIGLTRPMRFEEGQAAPSERSASLLDELAATLRANPTMRVIIEAHVAEESSADASLALTRTRAAAVRSALSARGVPQARLRAYGCGQARPTAPNNVPWGRKRNERVELHLLDPAPASGVHSTVGCVAAE